MDAKESNKIWEIVRLRQMMKKWKKFAVAPKKSSGISFLKRTLSLPDNSSAFYSSTVPKGYLAVCVGEEMKRFVIPAEYLSHRAFGVLLREAEEEFGFEQQGVLRIPCDVPVFESIFKVVEKKKNISHCSSETELLVQQLHHPHEPICR